MRRSLHLTTTSGPGNGTEQTDIIMLTVGAGLFFGSSHLKKKILFFVNVTASNHILLSALQCHSVTVVLNTEDVNASEYFAAGALLRVTCVALIKSSTISQNTQ